MNKRFQLLYGLLAAILMNSCDGSSYQYQIVEFERSLGKVVAEGAAKPEVFRGVFEPQVYIGPHIDIPGDATAFGVLILMRDEELKAIPLYTWQDEAGATHAGCNGPMPQFAHQAKSREDLVASLTKLLGAETSQEKASCNHSQLRTPDVDTPGQHPDGQSGGPATVDEVVQSLAKKLSGIAGKYPELATYKEAESNRGDSLFYSQNFVQPAEKREIKDSDFGKHGCYIVFSIARIPPKDRAYPMTAATLTLGNLGLYLWAEIRTGANPSNGLQAEVNELFQLHAEMLKAIDSREGESK